MDHPIVSIIIPTYNRLLFLAELAESLHRQTFRDFEVILVNDGGESVDIIKELYPDLKIRIIDMGENSNQVLARNAGVMKANGKYIMLMDDDDLLVPAHIENMLHEIQDGDLVYSDVEIVHFQWKNKIRIPVSRSLFAYEFDLDAMRRFSTFVPSGCLYRSQLHQMEGLFDPKVLHYWDWDFFLRIAGRHRVKRAPAAGVLYDFSDTHNNQSKNLDSRRYYLDKLSEKHHLGQLPVEDFQKLLNEPEVKQRKADSKILWDGKPFISKLGLRP